MRRCIGSIIDAAGSVLSGRRFDEQNSKAGAEACYL